MCPAAGGGCSESVKFVVLEQRHGMSFQLVRSLDDEFMYELSEEFHFRFEVRKGSFCRDSLAHIPGALFYDRRD